MCQLRLQGVDKAAAAGPQITSSSLAAPSRPVWPSKGWASSTVVDNLEGTWENFGRITPDLSLGSPRPSPRPQTMRAGRLVEGGRDLATFERRPRTTMLVKVGQTSDRNAGQS